MEEVLLLESQSYRCRYRATLRNVNTLLFYVFLWNVVFVPNDNFNLKIVSLGCLLFFNIPIIFFSNSSAERTFSMLVFCVVFYTIVKSALLTGELIPNLKAGYSGFILLLLPVIKKSKIDFYKAFLTILKMLSIFATLMALLDLLKILDMSINPILRWYSNSSNAMVGKGAELPFYYMIFFKTSPLLFVCLVDSLYNKKLFWAIVSTSAIVVSGTRANAIMLVVSIAVYFCFLQPNKKHRIIAIAMCCVVGVILFIDGRVINFIVDMFQRKSGSDSVRDGHLVGMIEVWKSDPMKFIFGSGYSSKFYSYGLNEFTANIELSYWNLLRQVGLFPFCIMIYGCLYPAIKLTMHGRDIIYVLAYLSYLTIAYSNPFLYSSTGLTMVLFMYTLISDNKGVRYEK